MEKAYCYIHPIENLVGGKRGREKTPADLSFNSFSVKKQNLYPSLYSNCSVDFGRQRFVGQFF
jgi:hypothetical protein